MLHPDKPKLTEQQFEEEFRVACQGLEHKYSWHINGVGPMEAENGMQVVVFDTKEVNIPIAFPVQQFAVLAHDCFYEQDTTLCDELHYFLLEACEQVNRNKEM